MAMKYVFKEVENDCSCPSILNCGPQEDVKPNKVESDKCMETFCPFQYSYIKLETF